MGFFALFGLTATSSSYFASSCGLFEFVFGSYGSAIDSVKSIIATPESSAIFGFPLANSEPALGTFELTIVNYISAIVEVVLIPVAPIISAVSELHAIARSSVANHESAFGFHELIDIIGFITIVRLILSNIVESPLESTFSSIGPFRFRFRHSS